MKLTDFTVSELSLILSIKAADYLKLKRNLSELKKETDFIEQTIRDREANQATLSDCAICGETVYTHELSMSQECKECNQTHCHDCGEPINNADGYGINGNLCPSCYTQSIDPT